jgi:hypothetical protein
MRRIVLAIACGLLFASPAVARAASQVVALPPGTGVIGPVLAAGELVYATGDADTGFDIHVVDADGRPRTLLRLPPARSPLGRDRLVLTGTPGGLVGIERDVVVCDGDCRSQFHETVPSRLAVARLDGAVTTVGGCGFSAACRPCALPAEEPALALTDQVLVVADRCAGVRITNLLAPGAPPRLLPPAQAVRAAGPFVLVGTDTGDATLLDTATGHEETQIGGWDFTAVVVLLEDGTVLRPPRLPIAAAGRFLDTGPEPPGGSRDQTLVVTDVAGGIVAQSPALRFGRGGIGFDGHRVAWITQACASPPRLVLWDLADPAPPVVDLRCERPGLVGRRLAVDRRGDALVRMRCPPSTPAGCRAFLRLRAGGRGEAFGEITLRPGASGTTRVGLVAPGWPTALRRDAAVAATLRVDLDAGPGQGPAHRTYRVRVGRG